MPAHVKSLVLCVHAHQPVGNFEHVFAEAFERSYRPFFEAVERHPGIRLTCHFSGSLIDWIERERPGFAPKIAKLVAEGRVEVLGGAYYEPIYGAIPRRDLLGQIEMMNAKVEKLFGKRPEGVWLTERVWDPELVKPLKKAGVQYTVLDDAHLKKARVPAPVTGYYRTKDGFDSLDIFASMQELRYLMPFRAPEETLNFVRAVKAKPQDVLVFADDCEKFGMWPGTHDLVFKQDWLDKLFELLEKDKHIDTFTFSEFRKRFPSKKDVKIPHASYSEMMEWSGGRFDNFFDKYPESRYMRDRMWSVSDAISRTTWNNGSAGNLVEAQRALYKAQCNCTYWHGVFGGLYLHHLRSAVFENLIRADGLVADRQGERPGDIRTEKLESGERWRVRQQDVVSFFNPAYGGALEEFDYVPKGVNLMCNLQRRPESYHAVLTNKGGESDPALSAIHALLGVKEKNLEQCLQYDPHRRLSFIDHFFESELGQKEFSRSEWPERGDFVGTPYKARALSERGVKKLRLERGGSVETGGRKVPILLRKTVAPSGHASTLVSYRIENRSRGPAAFTFGIEFNFSIGEEEARRGLTEKNVTKRTFRDAWRGIKIELRTSAESTLLAAPVETVSESECGLERTYQGLAVLVQRPFRLAAGEAAEFSAELAVV